MNKQVEDAVDMVVLFCFLINLFTWGIAFFYYVKFSDTLTALGILAAVPWVILAVGEVMKKT